MPIVDSEYLLEKFPGKGGWTYAEIPEIAQNRSNPFGWVSVRGQIDDYELSQFKLMPMGNGKLFLPVKAAIRKKIKKQAGDVVRIILFLDESDFKIPEEIIDCFEHESAEILQNFKKLSQGQQKAYIDWVYEAKTEETKVKRIVSMMQRVAENKGFYES
ncbi:DUF1905 domain-containing protein [Prolixibacteraceae bacterium JC049]|nr:DUF1905 domain-containing protein [Prolixibacteraceae bacterium JC049]